MAARFRARLGWRFASFCAVAALVTVGCVLFIVVVRARRQQPAIEAIWRLGGYVRYTGRALTSEGFDGHGC